MSWKEKIENINDLFIFCEDWKTRQEIAEKFGLTNIESWHCLKFCRQLPSDFETMDNLGQTKRSYAIRTRRHVLYEIGYL